MRLVRVRGSTFRELFAVTSVSEGVYDLGMPTRNGVAEPGRNTFKRVLLTGYGATFFASGNTWNAGKQDAGANGHYPDGEIWELHRYDKIVGDNVELHAQGNWVELHF